MKKYINKKSDFYFSREYDVFSEDQNVFSFLFYDKRLSFNKIQK